MYINKSIGLLYCRRTIIALMGSLLVIYLPLFLVDLVPTIVIAVSVGSFILLKLIFAVLFEGNIYHAIHELDEYKYKIICVELNDGTKNYIPLVKRYRLFPYEFLEKDGYSVHVLKYDDTYFYDALTIKGIKHTNVGRFLVSKKEASDIIEKFKAKSNADKQNTYKKTPKNIVEFKID